MSFWAFLSAVAAVVGVLGFITRDTASTRARIIALGAAGIAVLFGSFIWPGSGSEADPTGAIISPASGASVGSAIEASGVLSDIPDGEHVWLVVRDGNRLYPQDSEITPPDGRWSQEFRQGGTTRSISLELYRMGDEGNRFIIDRLNSGNFSGITRIPGAVRLDAAENLRVRAAAPAPVSTTTAKPTGQILSPATGSSVARDIQVRGVLANVPASEHVWLVVRDGGLLYPQGSPITPADGNWSLTFHQGGESHVISLELDRIDSAGNELISSRLAAGDFSGMPEIPGAIRLDAVENLRIKG